MSDAIVEWFRQTGINPWVVLVLLTFIPALELRLSIPAGICLFKLPWALVVLVASVSNVLIGPFTYFVLEKFLGVLLRIKLVDRLWQRIVVRTQRKLHPVIARHGVWGLSMFIGIPLPGTGVYSGVIGGYLMGLNRRQVYLASALGVLIAAAIVTALALAGTTVFDFLIHRPESASTAL